MNARKKLTYAVAGALAAFALGSAAFAAIPGSGGVINGCYDKQSGQLRVTDPQAGTPKSCTDKETALDWNQQGPQGIQGPKGEPGAQGVPGPQGPQGDAGPSDAFVKRAPDGYVSGSWYPYDIASLDLPQGKYVISANATLHHSEYAGVRHQCTLAAGNDKDVGEVETGIQTNPVKIQLQDAGISLTTVHEFTLGWGGTVSLTCRGMNAGQTTVKNPVITAIKVQNLTEPLPSS